jgi:putative oxidoreductase
MDIKTISLWVCIVLFALPAFYFGYTKVVQKPEKIADFHRWGYSTLFMILLGVAEIAGAIGLFFVSSRLFAIYGFVVILLGAIFTHAKAKENKEIIAPIGVFALLTLIYFLQQ